METSERLELSFILHPPRILASLFTPDGKETFRNVFEGLNCLDEWVATLKSVAAATKNPPLPRSHPPTSVNGNPLASLRSPSNSVGIQPAVCARPHRLSVNSSRRRVSPKATPVSRQDPTTRQVASAFPSPESISGLIPLHPRPPEVSQTLVSASIAEGPQANTSPTDDGPTTTNLSAQLQRTQKLEIRLQIINDAPVLEKYDFNDTVRRLYSEPSSASPQAMDSAEQFAHVLGRLGNIASVQGIVYSLLSWLIFRWEEERLIREEGQAPAVAAKHVNELMVEASNRRARTKDWASDGRQAAGMVFDSLLKLSTAAQSFAILVLAGNITLDGLLKTAHFPVLREHFRVRFTEIVESRQNEWEGLATDGYLVFDYKKFLAIREFAPDRVSWSSLSNSASVSVLNTPTHSVHSASLSSDASNALLMDMYNTCGAQVHHETQTTSAVESTLNANNVGMFAIDANSLLYDDLQADGFFELPNNFQVNMDFQLWPTDIAQDFVMYTDERNSL